MSVTEEHEMACPNCGEDSFLDVEARLFVRLTSQGSDADESVDGSHEWDDKSYCVCQGCGHEGRVADFRITVQKTA